MKVFISWSGNASHLAAIALRDWLPSVLQSIDPYVSSEDIEKGARWSADLGQQLNDTSFGILCVTKDNLDSSWLNFEAGALSKSLESSQVTPLLLGIRPAELVGPMSQFQATLPHMDDVKRLVKSLNSASEQPIEEARVIEAVEMWWSRLEQQLADALTQDDKAQPEPHRGTQEMIEELLEISRGVQRQLIRVEAEEVQEPKITDAFRSRQARRNDQLRAELQDVFDVAELEWDRLVIDGSTLAISISQRPPGRVIRVLDKIAEKYGLQLQLTTIETEHEEDE
jgi:hypothetical protein